MTDAIKSNYSARGGFPFLSSKRGWLKPKKKISRKWKVKADIGIYVED